MREKRFDRVGGGGRYGYGVSRFAALRTKRFWILVVILLAASGAWAILYRTNLMPNQRIAVSDFIEDFLAGGPKGCITGIVSGEDNSTALIDGQAVREGDSIHGVTVVRILPDKIEFEKNGQRWAQGLNEIPGRQWRGDAEAKAKAEAKAPAEAKAKADAEAKAKEEEEAKAQAEVEAKAKEEAEAKVRAEEEAKAKAQAAAEAKAKEEAEAKAQAQADAEEKAKAEVEAQAQAEAKAQAEAEAKAQEQAEAKPREETEVKAQIETETRAQAEEKAEIKTAIEPAGIEDANQSTEISVPQPADKYNQEETVTLIRQLGDREPFVRDAAVTILAQIGPPAVPSLIKAMEAEDWVVRQGILRVLGKIGDKRAVEPLINALEDSNQWIRQYAAEALGLIGDKRAIEPLEAALKDDSPNVRAAAAKGLVAIRGFAVAPPPDKKQADTLFGKIMNFKIYIGAGAAAVLLLSVLITVSVKRRKKITALDLPQHHESLYRDSHNTWT